MADFDVEAYRARELAGYESVATDYDRWLASTTARFAEPLLDAAGLEPGARVLDAACGPGVLTLRLMPRIRPGGRCLGIDFSDRMIEIARRNGDTVPGASFEVMDVERLAVPDGTFDAVVCGFGLMHVPDAARAMRELARVLKPGGTFAASVWAELPRVEFMRIMLEEVKAVAPDAGFPPGPPMFGFGSPEVFGPLLRQAGFRLRSYEVVEVPLTFPSFDAWWNALVLGAARLGGVVRALPEEARGRLVERLKRRVADRGGPEGLTLSGTAFIAAATRP